MGSELLEEFIHEALLVELRFDRKFINHLGLGTLRTQNLDRRVVHLVDEWIDDVEALTGTKVRDNNRAQVLRFVAQRMPILVHRFRGNIEAAEMTMYNLLNSRFNALKAGT